MNTTQLNQLAAIALAYLPQECVIVKGNEIRLISPEETDEMIEDLSNYEDGEWVGPHGKALKAIQAHIGTDHEVIAIPTWFCLRPRQEWTPSHELVFNNID